MTIKRQIQVGSRVELPLRSSYREPDPDVGFEGDTYGEVVKIKNDAAWVRMDSDRMDWFPIAGLKLVSSGRGHATRSGKKSPAQLDREIAEALASGDKPTTWMQRKALYDRGEHSGGDTFLLTYLPYHEMAPYKSSSAYGYGSYEACFETRDLAERRLEQLRDEGRIEWAKIYQHVEGYPFKRKLVDEWDDTQPSNHARARSRSHATKKDDPVVCKVVASIRLSGAPARMQTREFKHRADAQRWLDQQREIADRRGWSGYRFELTEKCEVV